MTPVNSSATSTHDKIVGRLEAHAPEGHPRSLAGDRHGLQWVATFFALAMGIGLIGVALFMKNWPAVITGFFFLLIYSCFAWVPAIVTVIRQREVEGFDEIADEMEGRKPPD